MDPAAQTAVVTDTTAYLPDELVAERGIHRISLYVTLDGEQRPEIEYAGAAYGDFYERLRRSEQGATTSQPSIGDFRGIYEPLLEEGREIVSIHISAGISGTCESARQATAQLVEEGRGGERIHVHDSRTTAGAQGMLVLIAARMAADGASAAQIVDELDRARSTLRIWFAVDTLEYLRKGGRIGAAQALLGSALQIKPILTFEEEVEPVERVRTRRRALERMLEFAHERSEAGADTWVVQHIQDAEGARALAAGCREVMGSEPAFVSEIGPVLGTHAGPGLLGFGGLRSDVLR